MKMPLTIRTEQMALLQGHIDRRFAAHMAQDIRQHRIGGSDHISDTALDQLIEVGIARARRYGFTSKYSIAMFVHFMLIIGADFDEYPPVRLGLQDQRYPPNDRIDRLLAAMTPLQWDRARQRCASTL